MTVSPIVLEQIFKAPASVVWEAITDKDKMRRWYFDSIPDFKPEVGFETQFDVEFEDQLYPHEWKVIEVLALKKITYIWQYTAYPGSSTVSWELNETQSGTKLTLTHKGHETFPQDNPVFSRQSAEEGWRYFLQDSLKEFVE